MVGMVGAFGCGGGSQPNQPPPDAGPVDAGEGSDGGGSGSDGGPAAPPPNTVTGVHFEICPAPFQLLPVDDLAATTVQALVPDPTANGGFQIRPATITAPGVFSIAEVPDGVPYLFQLGTDFFATNSHGLDLDVPVTTRCGGVLATQATPVTFDLTGMAPFDVNNDALAIETSATGDFIQLDQVEDGDTAVHTTFDWQTAPLPILVDAAAGDDVELVHSRTTSFVDVDTHRRRTTTQLVDAFVSTTTTLVDGQAATLAGSFAAPAAAPFTLAVDFAPYQAAFQDRGEPFPFSIQLAAGRYGADLPAQVILGEVEVQVPSLGAPPETASVPFSDPFPAAWQREAQIQSDFPRFYRGAGPQTSSLGVSTGITQLVAYTTRPKFAPVMAPASQLTINGVDALEAGSAPFDGTAPVRFQWKASADAALYRLRIFQIVTAPTGVSLAVVAIARTADTAIALPASLFTDNAFYAFQLQAVTNAGTFAQGRLIEPRVPNQVASIASGRIRLSSTCGNGKPDPGEDCDDGGESAACNADCTTSTCGDGVLNKAAGETCDTVASTQTCDATTCTSSTATVTRHTESGKSRSGERASRRPALTAR